LNEFRVVQM